MIKKHTTYASILFLLFFLSGCTSTRYGDVSMAPNQAENLMALDAVNKIGQHYPPARTQLDVQLAEKTVFDHQLISGLRAKGYALLDVKGIKENEKAMGKQGLNFAWLLDKVSTKALYPRYRLTLYVGTTQFDRLYQQTANTLLPAGDWSRGQYINVSHDDE